MGLWDSLRQYSDNVRYMRYKRKQNIAAAAAAGKKAKTFGKGFLLGVIVVVTALVLIGIVIALIANASRDNDGFSSDEVVENVRGVYEDHVIGSEGELMQVTSAPSLEDFVLTSEIQALTYHYNSICTVRQGGEPVYHIAYDGSVLLGIDATQITFEVDDTHQMISVLLPDVMILDYDVDEDSLDFIFCNESYNNPETAAYALGDCLDDLIDKTQGNAAMYSRARQNCVDDVEAMIAPLLGYYYPGYTYEINYTNPLGGGRDER